MGEISGARLAAFGAPPAGGCPLRMAGRWNRIYRMPRPRGEAAGPGRLLIFNRLRPAIRPARRCAPRRRHGFRFGTAERPCGNPFPHGVAASVKYRKSCSCFCREQSRRSEGIAVAMARVANAVIGKKNKTWCAYFMLAATPNASHRAVRSNAAREKPVFVNPAPWSLALRAPVAGTKNTAFASPHNRSHPWRLGSGGRPPSNIERRSFERRFAICVLLLQTLKAKPPGGFAATRRDRRAPRAARRRRRRLRSLRGETNAAP